MERAAEGPEEALLPECFAIVNQAIDRRLGVWRLFDDALAADSANENAPIIAETVADVTRQRRFRRDGDILLPGAFYEAARRHDVDGRLRFRATDEQLLGGMHLFRGRVVQMGAGEGKTVAIAFAAALHAVLGRRVHVITANDYLADRDAALLEPVYRSLGLSSGAVLGHMEPGERRHVYRRSIIYGAMRELGFDHLRDNLKTIPEERVQQPLDLAIVDEADHALIDEAFTPLIISGNPLGGTRWAVRVNGAVADIVAEQRVLAEGLARSLGAPGVGSPEDLRLLATLVLANPDNNLLRRHLAASPRRMRRAWALAEDDFRALTAGLLFAVAPGGRYVTLTDAGRDYLEQRLGPIFDGPNNGAGGSPGRSTPSSGRRSLPSLGYSPRRFGAALQVSQAFCAHLLLQRNVDYLVDDDSVVLIDPHTGRPKPDSIYQQGLQPAVEAQEGVTVRPENETLAQISVSGLVSLYGQVAGITGTAEPAAGELHRKYRLEIAMVPPVRPLKRASRPPVVYLSREDKLAAVVDEVEARHRTGQPVLLGTRTVEQSEELGGLLDERGIPHRVLNAVTTHTEAAIVREAGSFGAVTVATHMAGRGTDILLQPDLDVRMAQRCAARIGRMLTGGTGDTGAVEVSCPSPEQAAVLEGELNKNAEFQLVRSGDSCGLRIRQWGQATDRPGIAKLDFAPGLCVMGTEVHDSSRITLQLNGRSGRQGQFGITQTFLSLEDRLVSLDAYAILKLADCRKRDTAGRTYYEGPEVSRRIRQLQDAADREGEAQRALMQDYAAELDRQTHLYHQRRQELIDMASDPERVRPMCEQVVARVASRLAARHLGLDVDDDYALRFERMREELRRNYDVDCSPLYGLNLGSLPELLAGLLTGQLERQDSSCGASAFAELSRLLYLQVSGELWPGHLAALRDLLAVQLLSGWNHKSSVAAYIRRCSEAWDTCREMVDEEFLSRLATVRTGAVDTRATQPVAVSGETERLLAMDTLPPSGEDRGSIP